MTTNNTISLLLRIAVSAAVIAALLSTSCDPEVPQRAPPTERVEALFDPDTGHIPLPNDAAMENGRLAGIPGAEEGTAEHALSRYMQTLHGWPRTTSIEIPFGGALDDETIDEQTVRLYRIDDGELQREPIAALHHHPGSDSDPTVIEIVPEQIPVPGAQYAAAVTNELQGENGEGVSAAPPIFFAASRTPLVDEEGDPTLELFADDPETAHSLEGLRQLLAPLFEQIEEGVGDDDAVDRDDLATLFRWTSMPETVMAFHPDIAAIPLPHTAALDDDGTFPDQAVCHAEEDSAQGEFDRYLADLAGWPVETPLSITLTDAVDDQEIDDDAVQVWRSADGDHWQRIEPVDVSYRDHDVDPCTGEESPAHILDLELGEPMRTQEQYFAFATRELSEDGPQLVPEAPLLLMIQPHPLVDEQGASTVGSLDDDTAAQLEQLRQMLVPAMTTIEEELDLTHEDLAGAWSWYTWNDAFAVFDPETAIPFPNTALVDDEDDTVDLPIPADTPSPMVDVIERLNQRGGFSRSAPGWIPIDGQLDPESIDFDTFQLLNLGNLSFQEDEKLNLYFDADLGRLVFEPITPMNVRNIHVGALTEEARGINGRPVQPTPAFVFLRGEHPVYENGESTVDVLDDDTAERLEEARDAFEFLFTLAEPAIDLERNEMATAWGFYVEDPVQPMREIRALVMDVLDQRTEVRALRECEIEQSCNNPQAPSHLELIGDSFEDPNDPGVMVPMENVRAMYAGGEFESVDVDIDTGEVTDGDERIGLSVYLPEDNQSGGSCQAPYDVAIAQHGLGYDRWQSGLSVANDLAAYPGCMATVAMDFPLHGGRTADGISSPHRAQTPAESGAGFLSTDMVATKANFVQSVVDLFTLVQIIEGEGDGGLDGLFEALGEPDRLIGDRIGVVGMSLGAITAIPFAALEPAVDTVVSSAGGGRLSWLLEGDDEGPSEIGAPILEALEQAAGIEPGDEAFFDAMVFVQWLADYIDPFAFADAATGGHEEENKIEETLVYDEGDDSFESGQTIAPAEVLMQMADGDRVIVNRGTEALAHALGTSLDDTTFVDVPHSFLSIVDDGATGFEAGQCARQQAAAWLQSGLDGGAELPAELSADTCVGD